ncbi:MAG TPA: hypothetical protein VIX15_15140 [Streptosporangiaceae bacterium]
MSLPASQQRTLGSIEGRLRAADPHLASMFAIFSRLNIAEPVATERLVTRLRHRWQRPRLAAFAVVLIPAMFIAMVVVSALAGGRLSPSACGGIHRPSGASPLARSDCQLAADTTAVKATTVTRPAAPDRTENPACVALVQHSRSARGWVCYK